MGTCMSNQDKAPSKKIKLKIICDKVPQETHDVIYHSPSTPSDYAPSPIKHTNNSCL